MTGKCVMKQEEKEAEKRRGETRRGRKWRGVRAARSGDGNVGIK